MKFLIVGAGFSGAVIARELANSLDAKILVIEKRDHIAGNCYTERDNETGVMVHKYGAHIFHTSSIEVWKYVQKFSEFRQFINRPKASISSGIYSLPINLHTINQFFSKKLNPEQARKFIESKADHSIIEPQNFEEQALKFMGRELYEAFFYGYTKKQWGCDPKELPASILKRIPIRFNYNDNYYNSIYQGIPVDGYTEIVRKILSHDNIEVKLSTPWEFSMVDEFDHVFFTGPIDAFYNFQYGRLAYRTVYWERSVHVGDFQGHPGINYPELDVPYTRMREHKHYTPWERHEKTVVFTEYSKETGLIDEPYYPKRLVVDKDRLEKYRSVAETEERTSFLGRLATYRYMDMHQVIGEALEFGRKWSEAYIQRSWRPVFPEGA
ncbi:UDP-galactopyranose mutase [Umezakia ovalisporum]|uniref:UDP-galactopyranose mutase n=1 Tax=Umezakia ovalisporum FSS-62 TaxID=2971776 RepID=A0AA43KDG8_9CYAN|nr:UDP-galactopyranose mutase [Umezakia ovalisporum]MDH6062501.1 UDP-galactopyranose mutase [Umezakia ovalisporum FSS-62]MDH6079616.1 UDP-galactopyranose mutase [Umezakia ovalisporum FSS-45]MDH6103331.1 UDP-galactopyranose mutase [Umezakia ovalisporum ANA283AFssAo]